MEAQASQAVFTAQVVHLDGRAEVAVAGELDVATVTILSKVLDELFADKHIDFRVNASALTFLDAAGIGVLLDARQRALELGGTLRIDSLQGSPLRVVTICNLLPEFVSDARPPDDSPVRQSVHTDPVLQAGHIQ